MTGVKRDCQCPRARHQHGTRGAYQTDRCRCFHCRIAYSHVRATYTEGGAWHEGSATLAGAARRLQALHALGWTFDALAQHLGTSRQAVSQLANGQRKSGVIYASTAEKVRCLYETVGMVRPVGVSAHRARLNAQRKGWLPPLAWDDDTIDDPAATPEMTYVLHALGKINPPFYKGIRDNSGRPANPGPDAEILDEIAIEEAIAGRPVRLTRAEETVAQQRMRAMGYSQREIAERLRIAKRTVERRGRAA